METKICNQCQIEKLFDLFKKSKSTKSGIDSKCKECHKENLNKWRRENKDKVSIQNKTNRSRHLNKFKERSEKYRENNREKVNRMARESYYRNIDKAKKRALNYHEKHKERLREYYRKYNLNRRHTDPFYKFKHLLRGRIGAVFRYTGFKKNTKSEILLGASYDTVKKHIERQFKKGMSWENQGKGNGKWEADHIIPLASAKNEEELITLCHYTNLQPLWSKENNKKSAKIIPTQMKITI